jgi:dTDP-4-amino-4,6-dideoxygalactose transaminase
MDAILTLARKHNLRVMEDAAQAHGAQWQGKGVGGLGDLGSFSFQSSKNLNCGEGGAVTTNNPELAEVVWSLMNVGRIRAGAWYQHERLGWNYRLTEFQGALLLSQLTRVPEQMRRREANAQYLDKHLSQIPGITPQKRDARVTSHAHHLYMFRYDREAFGGKDRATFLKALRAEGIPCSPGYDKACHEQPAVRNRVLQLLKKLGRTDSPLDRPLPNTDRISHNEGVWFTQNMLLAEQKDMQQIVEAIAKVQRAFTLVRTA